MIFSNIELKVDPAVKPARQSARAMQIFSCLKTKRDTSVFKNRENQFFNRNEYDDIELV